MNYFSTNTSNVGACTCTYNDLGQVHNPFVTASTYNYTINMSDLVTKIENIDGKIKPPKIINIKVFKPNKVIGFTFDNKEKIKTICDDRDIFSLEYACFLAYAKLLFSKEYTYEGVLLKAEELQTKKEYIKLVKQAIHQYKEEELKKIKKEQEEAEKKAIKARRQKKAAEKRKKSQEAQIRNVTNILKEELLNK